MGFLWEPRKPVMRAVGEIPCRIPSSPLKEVCSMDQASLAEFQGQCSASSSSAAEIQRNWLETCNEWVPQVLCCRVHHLKGSGHCCSHQWDVGLADPPLHGKKSPLGASEVFGGLAEPVLAASGRVWRGLSFLHLLHCCLALWP